MGKTKATPKKIVGTLAYVEKRNIIGEIKSDFYTLTITDTHAVFAARGYKYVCDATSDAYIHLRGLVELSDKPDKTAEEVEMLENLKDIYTNNLNWHTLWFIDVELAAKVWTLHVNYLNEKTKAAMEAELTPDDPAALQELEDMNKFVEQETKELEAIK